MACLDNIVTLGISDDCEETNTSGFTLMMAPAMSPINLEKIATEQYVQGVRLAEAKKQLAIKLVKTDLLNVLQANNIATVIANPEYTAGNFNQTVDMGTYAGYRGIAVHGVATRHRNERLRKRKVKTIELFPLTSGTGEVVIREYQNGLWVDIPYSVNFVANQVNVINVNYVPSSGNFYVLADNTTINFASLNITCKKGCNGATNPCAWIDGWNGTAEVKTEGYGVNITFECYCDYDQILCDLSNSFAGQLIWYKWQQLILEEQVKTNRFNSWVKYNVEALENRWIPEVKNEYANTWNTFVGGLFNMLKNYQSECVDCRGIRKVVNI